MKKIDIVEQVTSVLKKYKFSISGLQVRIDNRGSQKGGYKAKVDIPVNRFDALAFLANKNKVTDLLRDIKAIDDKLIVKTQLSNVGKIGYVIRLYVAKKPCKIEKFVQRKVILQSASGLETKNHVLLNVKIGMTIEIVGAPDTISNSQIKAISGRFIKLFSKTQNKAVNMPINFFKNKTVIIIK